MIQGPVAGAGSSTAEAGETKKTEAPAGAEPKVATGEQLIVKTENPSVSRDPSPPGTGGGADGSPSGKPGEETDSSSVRTDTPKPQSKSPEPVSETTPHQMQQSDSESKPVLESDPAAAKSSDRAEAVEKSPESEEQAMEVVEEEKSLAAAAEMTSTEGKSPEEMEGKSPKETLQGETEGKPPEDQVEAMETESSGGDGGQAKVEGATSAQLANGRWSFN